MRILVIVAGILLAATAIPGAASAQDGGAAAAILRPEVIAGQDGNAVRVNVNVENVSNLGAFEFVLRYDGDLLNFERVEKGDFLGSSGREVLCFDPVFESGAMRYQCVTLGPEPEHGSDGTGVLASVLFSPKAKGKTTIELSRAKLSDPPGTTIPSEFASTTVTVFGDSGGGRTVWWLALVAAGIFVVVVAGGMVVRKRRRRSSSGLEE